MKVATKRAGATLIDFAELMTGTMKENHAYKDRTGHNTRSIAFKLTKVAGVGLAFLVKVFTESGYGGFLEIGTSKMPAFPYFRPGFDKTVRRLPGLVRAHAND